MTKKAKKDRVFTARTSSPVVARIQELLGNTKQGHFPWANALEPDEVRFLYKLASQAQDERGFQPTEAQGKWALVILRKIDLAEKTWKAATGVKMPSMRDDMVARRKAKEAIKKAGYALQKTMPPDVELALTLAEMGQISGEVTKKNATELLLQWSGKKIMPKAPMSGDGGKAREAATKLATLGGSEPELQPIHRRS